MTGAEAGVGRSRTPGAVHGSAERGGPADPGGPVRGRHGDDEPMTRWRCPACDREFGRAHQSHVCVPGCTVDACFEGRPPAQRAAYEAVLAHVRSLGPVHVDAVGVGVFLKADRTLAEVRPKARGLSLQIALPRPLVSERVGRTMRASAGRFVHVVRLLGPADVDDEVRAWLTEAYDAADGSTEAV